MTSLIDHKHSLLLAHAGLAPRPADSPATPSATHAATQGATLVMAVLRTTALIDRACAAELAAFDLTEGRLSVMLAVAARDADTSETDAHSSPARIADELGISRAAVTGLIDGLERQGLIERRAHSSDRRSTTVCLTALGRDALDRIGPIYGAWLRDLARCITPAAATGTVAALSALQEKLSERASDD